MKSSPGENQDLVISEIAAGTGVKSRDGRWKGVVVSNEKANGGDIRIILNERDGQVSYGGELSKEDMANDFPNGFQDGDLLLCEECNDFESARLTLKISEIKPGTGLQSRDKKWKGVVLFNAIAEGGSITIRWFEVYGKEANVDTSYASDVHKDGDFLLCEELSRPMEPETSSLPTEVNQSNGKVGDQSQEKRTRLQRLLGAFGIGNNRG